MNEKLKNTILKKFNVLTVLVLVAVFLYPLSVRAAALSSLSDTMSRLKVSEAADHTIKFTTSTGAGDVADTITITMPTGFGIGTVEFGDIDLSHGATTGYETEEVLAATADATKWGAAFAGQILTLTHPTNAANGDIAGNDKVVVEIGLNATSVDTPDAQIANHATPATYTITIGGTFEGTDTTKIAIVIVSNDQVALTAIVDPSITFSVSAVLSEFGALSTGSPVSSSPNITLTIGTNANSGYTVTVRDQGNGSTDGLYNSIAGAVIDSATADLGGAGEGYGIQGSSATATITAPYTASGTNVGALQRTPQSLATYGSNTTSDQTITVTHKARISASTKAGSYADTLTYIATGNF